MKRLFLFLTITLFSCYKLFGQGLTPSINVGVGFYPKQNVKDTIGTYAHQHLNVKFTTPLVKGFNFTNNEFRFYLVSLTAAASVDKTNLSFLNLHRKFYTGNVSVYGIYRASKKNMWTAAFTSSCFEDEYSIHQPAIRLSGFAFYRRSVSESFFYMLGGAYSFTFGRGIPLPVLGAGWRFTNHASLSMILPFSIQYQFGKKANQYTIFIKPNGGISNVNNNGLYNNAPQTLVFRRKEFTLGIKKRFKLSDQWSLLAETGLLTGRQLYFSTNHTREDEATLFKTKVHPGLYISIGLHYNFKGKQKPASQYDQSDIDYINDLP